MGVSMPHNDICNQYMHILYILLLSSINYSFDTWEIIIIIIAV
jgi:hypothetical protein